MALVLLAAILEDNRRVLFLEKTGADGKPRYCLPCAVADERENPVEVLKKTVLRQTGIDANVGGVALSGRHNAGSRKRKQLIGALAFSATAKSYSTKTTCRWMKMEDALKQKLARECEWMKTART